MGASGRERARAGASGRERARAGAKNRDARRRAVVALADRFVGGDVYKQTSEYQQYLIEEFAEDYKEGRLERRELVKRVVLLTGSVPAAATVLTSLGCNAPAPTTGSVQAPATATAAPSPTPVVGPDATVAATDPAIDARAVEFPGKAGAVFGYLAKPKQAGTYPGLIVIHENMGLVDHIQEVARRVAKVGFVALAVDGCSRAGGTARLGSQAEVSAFLGRIVPEDLTADFQSGIDFLKTPAGGARATRFGVFGFCFGGGYSFRLACASPDIAASVPFYGIAPPLDLVPNLRGAISAVYAGNDARINASIPDLETAMKAQSKRFDYVMYPNVAHGFHRSTDQPGHMDAAKKAWQQMVDFMSKELKAA
jgi:carboxymethylenebutenolidase